MKKIEDEDILAVRGAQLAGTEAPVKMNIKRAEAFVKKTLSSEKTVLSRRQSRRNKIAIWSISGSLAIAASAALVIALDSPGVMKGTLQEVTSVHCAIDSVKTSPDSTAVENFEIASINE